VTKKKKRKEKKREVNNNNNNYNTAETKIYKGDATITKIVTETSDAVGVFGLASA
jgi:hypothetical protein